MDSGLAQERMKKTFKREVAFLMLVFTGFIVWRASAADPVETLKVIIWPVMLFAGAAWGMEWAAKQTELVGKR